MLEATRPGAPGLVPQPGPNAGGQGRPAGALPKSAMKHQSRGFSGTTGPLPVSVEGLTAEVAVLVCATTAAASRCGEEAVKTSAEASARPPRVPPLRSPRPACEPLSDGDSAAPDAGMPGTAGVTLNSAGG